MRSPADRTALAPRVNPSGGRDRISIAQAVEDVIDDGAMYFSSDAGGVRASSIGVAGLDCTP